jgi:ACDE family multidrug resistance protein
MTVPVARARGGAVHVVHVVERDVVAGEDAIDLETQTEAALLDAAVAELREAGVPVTGEIVHSTGTHAEVVAGIMDRAALLPAGLIVIGADTERPALHGGIAAHVVAHAPSHVIVLNPRAGALGRPIPSVAAQADARGLWHAT